MMTAMPTANIWWKNVHKGVHRVEIRKTPKGGNSYYVVTDQEGNEFVPNWCSRTARTAQAYLDRLARAK